MKSQEWRHTDNTLVEMVVSHSFNPWFYDIMEFSFKAYWWKSRWNRWYSLYNIMGTIIWLMLFMNSNNQYSNKTHTFLFRSHSSNVPTSKTSFTGFHSLFRESLLTKAFSSISLYPWNSDVNIVHYESYSSYPRR